MGLRLKFNIVLIVVFLAGIAAAGGSRTSSCRGTPATRCSATRGLMMEAAFDARLHCRPGEPAPAKQMDELFLPQTVPAYAATEIFNPLRKKYPEYGYKEATLNPTNPRNRAVDWEADVVNQFRNYADLQGVRRRARHAHRAQPLHRPPDPDQQPGLPACHSTPSAAPPTMIKLYGEANGFGWKLNEIIGAQMVSVPMACRSKRQRAFNTFMGSLAAVFVAVFVVLNVMLSLADLRPDPPMSRVGRPDQHRRLR